MKCLNAYFFLYTAINTELLILPVPSPKLPCTFSVS